MGIFGQSKKEKELQEQVNFLKSQLTPAQQNVVAMQNQIQQLDEQKKWYEQEIAKLAQQTKSYYERTEQLNAEIAEKSSQIVNLNEYIDLQEFGFYKPSYISVKKPKFRKKSKKQERNLKKSSSIIKMHFLQSTSRYLKTLLIKT